MWHTETQSPGKKASPQHTRYQQVSGCVDGQTGGRTGGLVLPLQFLVPLDDELAREVGRDRRGGHTRMRMQSSEHSDIGFSFLLQLSHGRGGRGGGGVHHVSMFASSVRYARKVDSSMLMPSVLATESVPIHSQSAEPLDEKQNRPG